MSAASDQQEKNNIKRKRFNKLLHLPSLNTLNVILNMGIKPQKKPQWLSTEAFLYTKT